MSKCSKLMVTGHVQALKWTIAMYLKCFYFAVCNLFSEAVSGSANIALNPIYNYNWRNIITIYIYIYL
jgi:hypothetical protein